jgi:hypothetical protein
LAADRVYQRRQKYFTIILLIAMVLLAWYAGPN